MRITRCTFHVTDMNREQMEAAGYGFHHESEDGKYLIMVNGSHAFAIPSGDAPEHTAPEKLTVLVVEPMKEPYVKEIDPGLHALQEEVVGDISASYPFDDPVGLVLNDEGKLIGLDLSVPSGTSMGRFTTLWQIPFWWWAWGRKALRPCLRI